MTAKKSSIRTVVSGSERGVCERGFGGGLLGEDVKEVVDRRLG